MKQLLIGLSLAASISSFANTDYLCKTSKGNIRAVLLVEDSENSEYRLFDLYKTMIDGPDYSYSYSKDYERIAPYFGVADNSYSVKETKNGTEFYTIEKRAFGLFEKEVTSFLITKDKQGVAESCASGFTQGNGCSAEAYTCKVISSKKADKYLDLL